MDLRAERQGTGNGRVYTLVWSFSDGNGNTTKATCQVGVPHDMGGGSTPIDSGTSAYSQSCP